MSAPESVTCRAPAPDLEQALEEIERLRTSLGLIRQQVGTLEQQAAALGIIGHVTDQIATGGTTAQVLDRVLRSTTTLLGASRGSLMLIDADGETLSIHSSVGFPPGVAERSRAAVGHGLAGACAESGAPLLIRSSSELGQLAKLDEYRSETALCVPIRIHGETLGVLNVSEPIDDRKFTQADLFVAQVVANQAAIAISNSQLLAESVAAAQKLRSLEVARNIQQSFIPPEVHRPGLRVAGISLACEGAGGDYIDYWARTDASGRETGHFHVAIGDVSGHGVGAALIMATSRAFLRALLAQSGDLSDVMRRLNWLMAQDLRNGQFMTLFTCVVDPSGRRLTFASAGHDPPLLYRARTGELVELEATGPPLGVVEGPEFQTFDVPLEADDVLALTTDGTWDVRNEDRESFGRDRLGETLRGLAALEAPAIVSGIEERVGDYGHPLPLADDFSLIVVKCKGGSR